MIVAVPAEEQKLDSPLCVSFGRAPYYCVFDTETQKSIFIVNEAAQSPGGAGIQAAQDLVDANITTLITFRLGENAAKVLTTAGVSLLKALNLSIADNINAVLGNKLVALDAIHPGFHHAH
ncbi:NifB/NifX family molybdenum-iron cluster-binding protein [Sphaerochaeta globosa]|uniref:Dinitrogenase iron-molybdenum cofactor biosynthesis protein n=1 Tax=Sphaerochaeta globosa (strain ATCC BAA-1886 / DSM 22777 / Buddy) TaxID=158189 RepID=F0RUQ2_SPHGB|nr:NifB/NifX family molybdenum-iron cluster-binding protein [Sphaerochaeta globosa]ADY12480.1 Dinitrogenase iron-molybdenum cofactor biosynthesis protein [Sphaerochaeta globosa str. Buddy]